LIGALASGVALFVTTMLDQSVRTASDLEALATSQNVAIIPAFAPNRPPSSRHGGSDSGGPATVAVMSEDERVPA
jgi:archaellum component FlaG (FlaF/FlaG flagellin family)